MKLSAVLSVFVSLSIATPVLAQNQNQLYIRAGEQHINLKNNQIIYNRPGQPNVRIRSVYGTFGTGRNRQYREIRREWHPTNGGQCPPGLVNSNVRGGRKQGCVGR
jgi:acetamidase/formamidase